MKWRSDKKGPFLEKSNENLQKWWFLVWLKKNVMKICKNGEFRHNFRHFRPRKNVLGIANTHLCVKNQKNLMMKSRKWENAKKRFFRHFQPKKMYFENRAPSLFGHCHFLSFCQKSEKTNEPIPRKAGNRRKDEHRLI